MNAHVSPLAARNPAIDLFRLAMAALVLATHFLAPFFSVSFYAFGTGGFFIAAGYFCFANPQHQYTRSGFILMKILRLYPAYLIAVFAYLMIKPELDERWLSILLQHGLLLVTVTTKHEAFYLNPPFWCIPVFVEFFIIFALIRDRYDPVKLFIIALLFMISAKMLPNGAPEWLRLHFPYYAYAFFLGGIIYKIRKKIPEWPLFLPKPTTILLLCLAITIGIGSAFQWLGDAQLAQLPGWRFYHELCVFLHAITFMALLYVAWGKRLWPVVIKIAQAGFSIYLFHIFVLKMVQQHVTGFSGLCLAIIGTIGIAVAVQGMIENPIQRWSKQFRRYFNNYSYQS